MKSYLPIALLLAGFGMLVSCSTVKVIADYDRGTDFAQYKSYAFYKTGIDRAQISDLDKKRILRAIEAEMDARGYVKSETPDLLVSIFTTEKERIDVYNNIGWGYGWGWGWGYYNPWYWGGGWYGPTVTSSTEGSLYIDLIDSRRKELVWQGKGTGVLGSSGNIEKKEARIREFVSSILSKYPPGATAKN